MDGLKFIFYLFFRQYGDVCVYHMQSKYKKLSSKRGELQGTSAPGVPSKYKKTLWNKVKGDQFFYGGQVFSAAPPTVLHNQPRLFHVTSFLSNNYISV